jgi:large repetitive protein
VAIVHRMFDKGGADLFAHYGLVRTDGSPKPSYSAVRAWTHPIAAVAPRTTITSGPTGPTDRATPAFAFSSNETGSTFQCRVGGAPWAACRSPETIATVTDGAHTFYARAVDQANHVDATPARRPFKVDTVAPNTTITSGPSGPTADRTPTFAFRSSERGPIFRCSLDRLPYKSCVSPDTVPRLAPGSHTFRVQAIDRARNVDLSPASLAFKIGSTTPDLGHER